jgi:hypothetical protein
MKNMFKRPNDPGAVAGRKVHVGNDEVISAIGIIEALGRRLLRECFTRHLSPA